MSSDEEDISDAEISEVLIIAAVVRKPRTIRARPNHFNILGDRVLPKISHVQKIGILIALRVYATGGMLKTVGDVYGVSTTAVSNIVGKVTHYIAKLRDRFVVFPKSREELLNTKHDFYDIAKFPNVVAALDCTHVRILSPGGEDAELYRNRKGFFYMNVQTMCDAHLKILDIVARWPDSSHDSNILKTSQIYSRFCSGEFANSVIVADSGYPSKDFIMTQLSVKNAEENLYNQSQIRTRNCVERSYVVWKRRFPILSLCIRLNIKKVEGIIVATAVLHNICCLNNERELPFLPDSLEATVNFVNDVPNNIITGNFNKNSNARQNLINNYFKRLL